MTIEVCEITLDELRRLPRIPSGFETDLAFQVERREEAGGIDWRLAETALPRPLRKWYDSGRVDEWLESYLEDNPQASLRFFACYADETIRGVATWRHTSWNNSIWLHDIRVVRNARRTGIGGRLVEALKHESKRAGARGILVETQTSNYPAVAFYRKHGFDICGFNDHLYTNRDRETFDVALFLVWETS